MITSRFATVMLICLVVLAGPLLVHRAAEGLADDAAKPGQKPAGASAHPAPAAVKLPPHVAELREAILSAAESGKLDELRTPYDWNELKPDLGEEKGKDALAHLKALSADGEGRDVLAAIVNMLSLAPATAALGKNIENNTVYIWPYLAERDLQKLSPSEEVDLYRLMAHAEAKAMREAKKWTWWRLTISADGTWLALVKGK